MNKDELIAQFTPDELEEIVVELECSKDYCHYDTTTLKFLDELTKLVKARVE